MKTTDMERVSSTTWKLWIAGVFVVAALAVCASLIAPRIVGAQTVDTIQQQISDIRMQFVNDMQDLVMRFQTRIAELSAQFALAQADTSTTTAQQTLMTLRQQFADLHQEFVTEMRTIIQRFQTRIADLRGQIGNQGWHFGWSNNNTATTTGSGTTSQGSADPYSPTIDPNDFTTNIDNVFFSWPIGKKMIYEGQTADGLERTEITIPGDTKVVMGVRTLVYRDKVWVNNELVEDTRDYIAQDHLGNVWYFGEDVDNYDNGQLADHDGSWLAGTNGALPGIWIKVNPQPNNSYRQEYLPGIAEDMVSVIGVNETATSTYGSFSNCVKTYDWTALDTASQEHKYYCPGVRGLVRIENLTHGKVMTLKAVEHVANSSTNSKSAKSKTKSKQNDDDKKEMKGTKNQGTNNWKTSKWNLNKTKTQDDDDDAGVSTKGGQQDDDEGGGGGGGTQDDDDAGGGGGTKGGAQDDDDTQGGTTKGGAQMDDEED